MRNIKLIVEYDGTRYCGWQIQPGEPTVQAELEKAVEKFLQQKLPVIGAGRTDSGVHALGQVASFRTDKAYPPEIIAKALNRFLPLDIRVLDVADVPLEFNPRFDAIKRRYRYHISLKRHAINRFYSWYCKYPLDLQKMKSASQMIIGEHDFTSFCKASPDVAHYRCIVESITWSEMKDSICMEIVANRFLHNMVRIIVGTLVEVGRGSLTAQDVRDILEKRDRNRAGRTIPARGLFLVDVEYP
ncbi:tRNA pseudouridine(38-40) synthase TruA [candidate division KSB1 bacterium]|nr:tRNA pseudouridine(38-40) synthase TruA [candidate division KSB1 bacterium]